MKSSAFISYHHSDKVVGEALYAQLDWLAQKGKGRPALSCFLDLRDIKPATPWEPVIDKALSEKDWLIVIFTGEQSVYCGYEIGTFKQVHAEDIGRENPVKRITCLHDVDSDAVPVVLKASQNTLVPSVDRAVEERDVKLTTEEASYWFHSALGRFLVEFCNYKKLYTLEDAQDDPSTYSDNIALSAKKISNAYALSKATDVKEETACQIGFEVLLQGAAQNQITAIPLDAVVTGDTLTFAMIGLSVPTNNTRRPTLTWGRLKEKLSIGRGEVPWLHKVEGDILLAADNLAMTNDDVTFRGKSGKIFRPILSRHQLFVNGDRAFFILLVETLDRRFAGSPNSSLVLTSIILASRWRFTYFERWAETVNKTFGQDVPVESFADGCRQLIYNIEWIEHESAEFGANDVAALVSAFGGERRARVERFFIDWDRAKAKLIENLPNLDVEVNEGNRAVIRESIVDFLESTRAQNGEFLSLALEAYSEIISIELGKNYSNK